MPNISPCKKYNVILYTGLFLCNFYLLHFQTQEQKGQKFPCLQYATTMNSRCASKYMYNKIEVLYTGTRLLVPIFMSCLALRKECTS